MGSHLKPRVVFRCDANSQTGHGHLVRCHELARALRDSHPDFEVSFLGNFSANALALMADTDLKVAEIAQEEAYSLDGLSEALQESSDFLWLDSYLLEQGFLDTLTRKGIRWGAFDDYQEFNMSGAQLVVNFRVGAEEWQPYGSAREARGLGYLSIADGFLPLRLEHEENLCSEEVETILVCMGGSDIHGVSIELTRRVAESYPGSKITLVLPSELRESLPDRVTVLPMQRSIIPLMNECDLLVCGGGRLKYEAGFCGIANASLSQTAGESEDGQLLERHGLTVNLGLAEDMDGALLHQQLQKLSGQEARQEMRREQFACFDRNARKNLVEIVSRSIRG